MYCFEGADNPEGVANLILPPDATFQTEYHRDLLGGVVAIKGRGKILETRDDGTTDLKHVVVTAIPYYAWAHRGRNEMAVWLPTSADRAVTAKATEGGR